MSTKTRKTKKTKATEAQAPAATDTLSSEPTSSPTNLYTADELRIAAEGSATYDQMANDRRRHPDDILKKVGPALLVARAGALKIACTTNVRSQTYRDAIPGELKRLKLDHIPRSERSYCLKIMDNLADVEAWLAGLTNRDRLTHPKSIWKAWEQHEVTEWTDDPGIDPEDKEDYWGEPPDEWKEIDCQHCGRKTIDFVPRAEGRYCPECHEASPEGASARGDDNAKDKGKDKDKDGAKGKDNAKGKDRADKDNAGDDEDRPFPDMPYRKLRTIGQLKEYIEEAIRRGAKPANKLFIRDFHDDETGYGGDLYSAEVSFLDDEGDGSPPFMMIAPVPDPGCGDFMWPKREPAPPPAAAPNTAVLQQRITDLESKLATAVAERKRYYLENASLSLINQGLQKQLAAAAPAPDPAPPTVPADDDSPPKVDRKVINKALKKTGNDPRKVKPSEVIPRS
jgi:hypothetical protein